MQKESLKVRAYQVLNFILIALLVISFVQFAFASTPNPGHSWAETGDGTFAVNNTLTGVKTFTFPNYNATVLTNNSFTTGDLIYGSSASTTAQLPVGSFGNLLSVSSGLPSWIATSTLGIFMTDLRGTLGASQGGTGISLYTPGDILYASGTSTLSRVASSTGGTLLQTSFTTGAPSWVATSTLKINLADTTGILSTSQGGTGSSTLFTNAVLLGNGTSPVNMVDHGAYGNVLTSDGTTWVSQSPATTTTIIPRPIMATGAVAGVALNSLTVYNVALFTIDSSSTINQLTYNVSTLGTGGTHRICLYNEDGTSKLLDVTKVAANGVNSVTVTPIVSLSPGNYYLAMGCAVACGGTLAVTKWTSTAAAWINGATVPAGKKKWEGTATMTSGTCNTTLPAITGAVSSMPVIRFDN